MTEIVGKGGRTPPYFIGLNNLKERMYASPDKCFRRTIKIVCAYYYKHPFYKFEANLIKNEK